LFRGAAAGRRPAGGRACGRLRAWPGLFGAERGRAHERNLRLRRCSTRLRSGRAAAAAGVVSRGGGGPTAYPEPRLRSPPAAGLLRSPRWSVTSRRGCESSARRSSRRWPRPSRRSRSASRACPCRKCKRPFGAATESLIWIPKVSASPPPGHESASARSGCSSLTAAHSGRPGMRVDYGVEKRPYYTRLRGCSAAPAGMEDPDRPGLTRSFDLLFRGWRAHSRRARRECAVMGGHHRRAAPPPD
jgi:hypothetical protein